MAYNLITCDRNQSYLLPPSINDWLEDGHLARFIGDVVDEVDLSAFYARRREDGGAEPPSTPGSWSPCCSTATATARGARAR